MPVRIGLAAGAVRKRWRQRKAVLTARALGRGDHRLALAQRPAEVEPALLLPQPGQRRAGQRVEAPAASLAPEPPQSVGLAAADRRPVAAVRAAPFVTRARLGIVNLLGGSRGLGAFDGVRASSGYAASLMPQTSCHAWK